MPIDLSGLVESIQRGLGLIPSPAIAIALLAGPTAVLIGYRLIGLARRRQIPSPTVAALWVCQDCRSVNDLRLSRCYRCGLERDAIEEIDVMLEVPPGPHAPFEVPAGSPFAALGGLAMASHGHGPGVPVMADRSSASDAIPVGPGHFAGAGARPSVRQSEVVSAAGRDSRAS